jgi:hypothetical protein
MALEPLEPESESKFRIGFCGLDQFYPDNALDALYYIEMNHIKTQSIISIKQLIMIIKRFLGPVLKPQKIKVIGTSLNLPGPSILNMMI